MSYPEGGGGWIPEDAPVSEAYRKRAEKWRHSYVSVWQKLNALVPAEEHRAMRAGVYSAGGIDMVHRNFRFQMLLELILLIMVLLMRHLPHMQLGQ